MATRRETPSLDRLLRPEVFQALGAPHRLAVVMRLLDGPRTVSEVQDCCGIHLSGVSRHLSQLKRAGVVEARREGREVRYRLRRESLAAWFAALAEALDQPPPKSDVCCLPEGETP